METNVQNDSITASLIGTSIADWFFQRLKLLSAEKGETAAQIFADDDSSWTFEKLFQSSVHVAAGLEDVGIYPGDVAAFVVRNTHELYAIVLGCLMSDVTVAPSFPGITAIELKENFLLVKPQVVIAGAPFVATVEEAIHGFESKPKVFEVHQLFRDTCAKSAQTDLNAFEPVRTDDPKSHICTIMFSSGTTGKQKATAVSDYGFMHGGMISTQLINMDDVGAVCNSAQFNWGTWWWILYRSLSKGWTRVFRDDVSVVKLLDATQKHKISIIFDPPRVASAMAHELNASPGRWDLSSLRLFLMMGDVCNERAHKDLTKKLNTDIHQEYGATELGVVLQGRMDCPVVYGSIGKPLVPTKLVDPDTRKEITEPNKPGEIVVGWILFSYYIDNPEANSNAYDENGWYKTGDIAYYDESGNYFILGRSKEMFKYYGQAIYPRELEEIIMNLPGVKDVAVAGKFAGLHVSDVPTAVIVKSEDSNITEKDVQDHLEKYNLHDAKRLRGGVIFTNQIPRNNNGKIVRAKVREFIEESQKSHWNSL